MDKIFRINPYMGSGSDHLAFLQRAGVPCIDQRFIRDNVGFTNDMTIIKKIKITN
jgi:hypothetical protein